MDDTVDGRVLGKDLIEALLVGHIDLVEDRSAATQKLNAVEGHLGGVVQAVDDDDIVAVLEQGQGGEGANVARATGEQEAVMVSKGVRLVAQAGGLLMTPGCGTRGRGCLCLCWQGDFDGVPSDQDGSNSHCEVLCSR